MPEAGEISSPGAVAFWRPGDKSTFASDSGIPAGDAGNEGEFVSDSSGECIACDGGKANETGDSDVECSAGDGDGAADSGFCGCGGEGCKRGTTPATIELTRLELSAAPVIAGFCSSWFSLTRVFAWAAKTGASCTPLGSACG
jgi:hypothetical protein